MRRQYEAERQAIGKVRGLREAIEARARDSRTERATT
jgi:hypothetical protein